MSSAAVSVVICTYNRSSGLDRVLNALSAQAGQPFEVVVVDDGSPDDTAAVVAAWQEAAPYSIVSIPVTENGGLAKARNRGWQAASGDFVLFTDDDCQPQPRWVDALTKGLATADMAQGQTLPNPAQEAQWGPFSHTIQVTAQTEIYEGCNMGFRRELLERVGGWDESFNDYGDDIDLSWRARQHGAAAAFVPDALVYHDISPSDFVAYLRRLPRREGLVRLVRKHPELRSLFHARMFQTRSQAAAIATVASGTAVLLRPRSPLRWLVAASLGLAHFRFCTRERRHPSRGRQWPRTFALAVVADVAEVGVFVRASARHRTLFL